MRALTVDHSVTGHLRPADVPDPVPGPHQALVRVHAISLNPGELSHLLPAAGDGAVPGWDAAGVVVGAAEDGSGPAVGTPVVTLGADGAWAQLRAVDTEFVGTVPDGADPGAISTVPVAATSALRALRRLGPVLGRRVLITGATGGVGRYAVQLAAKGGAHVIATARNPVHADGLRRLGAHEVVSGPGELTEPVFGVLDLLGGPHLVAGYQALAAGGTLVAVGHSAGAAEVFEYGTLFADEHTHDRSIVTFFLTGGGIGADMSWLASLVAGGELDPQITWRGDWTRIAEAADALLTRRTHGKVVLDLT